MNSNNTVPERAWNEWMIFYCPDCMKGKDYNAPGNTCVKPFRYHVWLRHLSSPEHQDIVFRKYGRKISRRTSMDEDRYVMLNVPFNMNERELCDLCDEIAYYGVLTELLYLKRYGVCVFTLQASGRNRQGKSIDRALSIVHEFQEFRRRPVRVFRKALVSDEDWHRIYSKKEVTRDLLNAHNKSKFERKPQEENKMRGYQRDKREGEQAPTTGGPRSPPPEVKVDAVAVENQNSVNGGSGGFRTGSVSKSTKGRERKNRRAGHLDLSKFDKESSNFVNGIKTDTPKVADTIQDDLNFTSPDEDVSEPAVSAEEAPNDTVPDEDVSEPAVSAEEAPNVTVPDEDVSEPAVSAEEAPNVTVPDEVVPEPAVSTEEAPSVTVSDEDAAKPTVSAEEASNVTVSDEDAAKPTVSNEEAIKPAVSAEETPIVTGPHEDAPKPADLIEKAPSVEVDVTPDAPKNAVLIEETVNIADPDEDRTNPKLGGDTSNIVVSTKNIANAANLVENIHMSDIATEDTNVCDLGEDAPNTSVASNVVVVAEETPNVAIPVKENLDAISPGEDATDSNVPDVSKSPLRFDKIKIIVSNSEELEPPTERDGNTEEENCRESSGGDEDEEPDYMQYALYWHRF